MWWEIPTAEITLALEWAAKHLKGSRTNLWFSISKGGLRHLGRIGIASSNDFYGINFEQVNRYVLFDTSQCNLFTLGELIITQGINGVPIGGFLSAQLAEIWARWGEVTYLFGDSRGVTETSVNESIKEWGNEQGEGYPLPTLTLPGNKDFTLGPLEAQTMS